MPVVLARTACALMVAVLSTGCGHDVVRPDTLAGDKVAAMAERELEAENQQLTRGTLSCPDLDFHVGASVRCLRTTTLTSGRVVKVGGTVRVTSLVAGGRLHVAMDEVAEEFGITGEQVATELRAKYGRMFGGRADSVTCPYVRGQVGVTVTCRVQAADGPRRVDAVVAHVDAEKYAVRCAFRPHRKVSAATG
ncbi:hypothetical protein ACVW00_003978 [Marmoricola sp. URHA0025 HA25]